MSRLFRHIAHVVLSGIILTLAGCAYDDTVRELREQPTGNESLAIAFSNGIIDNPVKIRTRAVTLLSEHSSTMGVWGWQTTPEGVTERLFLNQEITFSPLEAKWTYDPIKYWESRSTYRFYAYAPHSGSYPGVTATIDSITHAISIKGVTLQGSNSIDSGVPAPPANFSRVADADWMLDRTGQSMAGMNHSEVTFNMQHILAKLCIRVRRSSTFLPDSLASMAIDSLKIGSFICQGDFVQSLSSNLEDLAHEWTVVDTLPRYNIISARNVSIPDSAVYILESLLIPQGTNSSQNIHVWYSIGSANHMHSVFSLNDLFSGFASSKNYVITITIGPDPIQFSAGVMNWDSRNETRQINQE